MYEKILVPSDGSECSEKALEHAVKLAEKFESEIHLLYVVDVRMNTAGEYYSNLVGTMREQGEDRLKEKAEEISSKDVDVQTSVIEGIPHTEINDYSDEYDTDLIVMGTHGRTGLNRLLIGSVTEKIVRTSKVPVLTVGDDH